MANGIVRLERFFSKRRPSSTPSTESNSPVTPSEPQFPSPSFIRPKASRMTARKETYLRQTHRPTATFEGVFNNESPTKASAPISSIKKDPPPRLPMVVRSSSFDDGHCDSLFNNIYQFPVPPSNSADQLPLLDRIDLESMFDGFTSDSSDSTTGSRYQASLPTATPPRETAPVSEEAVNIQTLVDSLNKRLPDVPPQNDSKEELLGPETDWDLADSAAVNIINNKLFEDIEKRLGESIPQSPLRNSRSDRTMSQGYWRDSQSSCPSSVLWEPDFGDFMTLSDEDIAESNTVPSSVGSGPEGELPPTPLLAAPAIKRSSTSRRRSLLTLTPPYACKPAAAAAFEAARIASRYDFDLVYVVNLWPDSTRPRTPSMDQQETTRSSSVSPYHMTGRLLAAYGLERAKSPFQITTSAHTQILRSEDWIEYRSQVPWRDEFAQGYACSFFTGQYSRSNSIASNISASTQVSIGKIDRGLVFAAYRNPKEDGTMRNSDEKELKALKRDAEGLVEMLIDLQAAHRLRQAPLFTQLNNADPIPARDLKFT